MMTPARRICLLIIFLLGPRALAKNAVEYANAKDTSEVSNERPLVLGHGVGRFQVGEQLWREDFDNLDRWVVQLQQRSGFDPPLVETHDQSLDCYLPGRGCTVWFKEKLPPRVAITYDVLCPATPPTVEGLLPRDINNFWMATDPIDPDQGLFDSTRYTGDFGSYSKMHGYYASTGGGRNTTTRMRRYPRSRDEEPVQHLALTDKDRKPDYMITPGKVTKVQLVAYDDVIQYVVDGKLNYEIARGDSVWVEGRTSEGKKYSEEAVYDLDRFPVYREGYFGFRMVGTHHLYSNFKVHALEPAARRKPDAGTTEHDDPAVRVSSLVALREAMTKSNQRIVLEPGLYEVSDRRGFRLSGSNNVIDLSDTHIKIPLEIVSGRNVIRITGDNNTLRGGRLENTYPHGVNAITDYGSYNQGKIYGGMNEIVISGDDNRVVGLNMTVRGSYPYGYGNMFGIGGGSVLDLSKHCGIKITGDRALIEGCDFKMEAFGHVIYVQGGDRTTVRDTVIEGTVRPSNDCYSETDPGDLAMDHDYEIQWPESVRGVPIPRDHMINCTEDGIRAYKGAGEMIVDNCVVKKTRGGIKLYMAKSARVTNCKVIDCVVQGYSVPSGGVISGSSGNAAYGPLLYMHSDLVANQKIDLEVLPSPHGLGDHPLAAIKGRGHSVTFTSASDFTPTTPRPIIVGYKMRFGFLGIDYPDVPESYEEHFAQHAPRTYQASRITVDNGTNYPVVLGSQSEKNSVTSRGPIRDEGMRNTTEWLGDDPPAW